MRKSLMAALAWALIGILTLTGTAFGVPAIPFSPYGIARVDGVYPVPDTSVAAWCGGQEVCVTPVRDEAGASWYANLDVPGDDPTTPDLREGCLARETVTFRVGTAWATQAVPWASTSVALTLTASTQPRLAPMAPTPGIALSGEAIQFSIPADSRNTTYEVWRGLAPYFLPGSTGTSVIANAPADCQLANNTYTCSDTSPNPSSNVYYLIRAGNATSQTTDSGWMGRFSFALQPGSP